MKRGGGLCEVGFSWMEGKRYQPPLRPLQQGGDRCRLLGVLPQDYPTTFDFLKRAYGIGLPLTKLISHRFKLDEIAEALETNVQMKGIKIAVICG
ncbi:MAG: hypothetical protein ACLRPT_07285 [Akkermansia muciniphila]